MLLKKGYGFLYSAVSLFLFFFILLTGAISIAQEISLLEQALKKAEESRLHDDRYWHILLHYKPGISGFKSLIDDPVFFLSPDGKENPEGELLATINAFFESQKTGDDHPICKFAARFEWLKGKLDINESIFSHINCADFIKTMDTVKPMSAVLVFPAFYMNNPASMFGHTLIRIDSFFESKLLSHAANYAAYVDDYGILYPIKGIFGVYKGYFKVFPYYERIKEYNDIEQRDMWEYRLNLSQEEVKMMFRHLWELKDVYSYYYFFDENCSYNLLYLIEAARPSLRLTDKKGAWVIPVDTIRAVKESGIVEGVEFRAAKAAKIKHIASLLDAASISAVIKIVEQKLEPSNLSDIDNDRKIKILDLAVEVIQYKYNRQEMTKDEYLRLFLAVLKERSKLGRQDADYRMPFPTPPDEGHLSSRVSFGFGIQAGVSFQEIKYRPAYHSLIDQDQGYTEGAQIIFMDTTIRRYADGRIRLEGFELIDIISVSPRDDFFTPVSFKVKTGLIQKLDKYGNDHLAYGLNPGAGLAFKNRIIGLYYVLAEGNLSIGGGFKDNYAAGIGVQAGIIKNITDWWKINLSAETIWYGLGENFREDTVQAVQTFGLNRNNGINMVFLWNSAYTVNRSEIKLSWSRFF